MPDVGSEVQVGLKTCWDGYVIARLLFQPK